MIFFKEQVPPIVGIFYHGGVAVFNNYYGDFDADPVKSGFQIRRAGPERFRES
jgi:hypothetical protein